MFQVIMMEFSNFIEEFLINFGFVANIFQNNSHTLLFCNLFNFCQFVNFAYCSAKNLGIWAL